MLREVLYKDTLIKYNLTFKKVKNINLRIKADLSIEVSANKQIRKEYIDNFVISKGEFILKAFDKIKNKNCNNLTKQFKNSEFNKYISDTFNDVFLQFFQYNITKPQLKMRKMTSCWGSCNYVKNIITLNTNLIYCSKEQIYYVIVHEFAHLIVHNHSKEFYKIVEKYCKNYKEIRKQLNKIYLK